MNRSHSTRQALGRTVLIAILIAASAHAALDGATPAAVGSAPLTSNGEVTATQTPIVNTGGVYYIGDDIPIVVTTQAGTVSYTLEKIRVDAESIVGETFSGTGTVSDVAGIGRVAFLPTSMLTKKGVYFVSGTGISRRRILLVDPLPTIQDATTWPFGLITSRDQIEQGAALAEEFYRVGIRFFHFDYPISTINSIGASSDPNAGRISAGFESFLNRAAELGIQPIFKLMSHYSQISGPTNLNGNFYNGLRKIQTYYQGKIRYWTIGNEVEGGGYSVFSPTEYANVIKNMSITLKGVDPNVKIIAGEFYSAYGNQHLDTLIQPQYRDYWDVLSGHRMVGLGMGTAPVSEYIADLEGLNKPVWDTEANGTIYGGPSEWSWYQQSRFPIESDSDVHSGINKHIVRTLCLQTLDGSQWRPAFYNPDQPCIGANLHISMHYNANWETLWALRRHWINNFDQPSEMNEKVANFRTVADMLYGAKGVTRIPNTDVANPYNASPTAKYVRADGYIYQYGPEYLVMMWQNTGQSSNDREMILTTDDAITLVDAQGNAYPLQNNNGQVKVWVGPEAIYLRGFTEIPVFALDSTSDDAPYFVTAPVTQAVVGQPYYYTAWAYDSDRPASGEDSLPRITYSLVNGPSGMTIQHGRLAWTPASPGAYTITIRATSAHGSSKTVDQTFTLNVVSAATNLAPIILSRPTTFGPTGYVWRYNLNAHDPNGSTVAYALIQAPAGMTIDSSSGFIQWTPQASGQYPVTVSASDGSASTTQSFAAWVSDAPGVLPLASMSASPGAADLNQTITYAISLPGTGRPITVTDVLPAQLDHLSSTTECPGGPVVYNSGTRQVSYVGTLNVGPPCAIQIATRVNTGQRMAVVNTASIDDDLLAPYNISATVVLNGFKVHLPLILKNR
jgi:hypothetical protein